MQSLSLFLRTRPLLFQPLLMRPLPLYEFPQRGVRLQLRINRRLRKHRQEKAKKEIEASKVVEGK